MTSHNMLRPVTRSKFINSFGADNLPWILLISGLLIGVLMHQYTRAIRRLPRSWVIPITQIAIILLLVAFWFGALVPLYLVSNEPSQAYAVAVLRRFSAIAGVLVPLIALAGLAIAYALAPALAVLRQPYGGLLLAKLGAFAVLMALAGYNRWRLVPAIESGRADAYFRLRHSIAAEALLIVGVLGLTAVLTEFFAPES